MRELLELARLRLERDLSYKALGEEIGVSERTVYRLINFPRQRLHERTAFKISQYLRHKRTAAAAR